MRNKKSVRLLSLVFASLSLHAILSNSAFAVGEVGWTERIQLLCEIGTKVSNQKHNLERLLFIKGLEFACPDQLEILSKEVIQKTGKDLQDANLSYFEDRIQELTGQCKDGKSFDHLRALISPRLEQLSDEVMTLAQETFDKGLNSPSKVKFDPNAEMEDEVDSDELKRRQKEALRAANQCIEQLSFDSIFDGINLSEQNPDFKFMKEFQKYLR